MYLLKSYFNLEIKPEVLNTNRIANRYKRLTSKKIYLGRGDIKHTSSKATITIYVYNTQKMYLSRAVHLTKKGLFYPKKALVRRITEIKNKKYINYNRPLNLKEFLGLYVEHQRGYVNYSSPYIEMNNLYLNNLGLQRNILTKLVNLNLISVEDRREILTNLYENINFINNPEFETYMDCAKEYYLKGLKRFKYLLGFNEMKYSQPFISKVINLVQDIYEKKIAINIVNLKKMHFSSDIYTQIVAFKLRNRENRLYRVLRSSLNKVKLPDINREAEKFSYINKDKLLVNIIRNDNVTSMFKTNEANDPLNNLLLKFFPSADSLKFKEEKSRLNERNISLKNYILKTLKHIKMRGIRVEAKGRLTKRFTAARSVFKLRLKGGLKNVDSSFKGLSTIMLRGHVKSNVQYSFLSSKNRNGAYGIKG